MAPLLRVSPARTPACRRSLPQQGGHLCRPGPHAPVHDVPQGQPVPDHSDEVSTASAGWWGGGAARCREVLAPHKVTRIASPNVACCHCASPAAGHPSPACVATSATKTACGYARHGEPCAGPPAHAVGGPQRLQVSQATWLVNTLPCPAPRSPVNTFQNTTGSVACITWWVLPAVSGPTALWARPALAAAPRAHCA